MAPPAGSRLVNRCMFPEVSLTELVDSPLIAGEHLRKIPLDAGKNPPAFLDLVVGIPQRPRGRVRTSSRLYSRVVREAGAMFGTCHYPAFHFLVTCSDDLGYLGLEHLASSINGVRERDLLEANRGCVAGWPILLPHEYVHSWCGKFRRPAGMCTPELPDPAEDPASLGLRGTGRVSRRGPDGPRPGSIARGGIPPDVSPRPSARSRIAKAGAGGRSRTRASASHLLRGGSPNWSELRREQDYYFEGALIWLEADAIIRERRRARRASTTSAASSSAGSPPRSAKVVPYELSDVVKALNEVWPNSTGSPS